MSQRKKSITTEIRKYFEVKNNENVTYENMDIVKSMFMWQYRYLNEYITKKLEN